MSFQEVSGSPTGILGSRGTPETLEVAAWGFNGCSIEFQCVLEGNAVPKTFRGCFRELQGVTGVFQGVS